MTAELNRASLFMAKQIASFVRNRYPYVLGFLAIEAAIYYFHGPTGNFTAGLAGLFVIWIYYSWTSRE